MAEFECKVYELEILPHGNADALELAKVGDYLSVVRKGQYRTGSLGIYIPEASIVPKDILSVMGLWDNEKGKGMLAGPEGNRVKAIRLRGVLSQGLIYPVDSGDDAGGPFTSIPSDDGISTMLPLEIGMDVANDMGIKKYEPPIPTHMSGEVLNLHGHTLSYDIENIKKYPDVLQEGEVVYMTEKLHGSLCCLAFVPGLNNPELLDGHFFAVSKGLSGQGLVLKENEKNATNLYVRVLHANIAIMDAIAFTRDEPVYILGEIFGRGVQDLTYGLDKPEFRVFDVYIGTPGQGRYLSVQEFIDFCNLYGFIKVPHIASGTYTKLLVETLTKGKETISNGAHMREGLVIRPLEERRHPELGRVILKSVNEDYLLRKGNTTEFN